MKDLERKLKELEVRERKLKNRTFWITVLTPLLTIFISFITTQLTINKDFKIDKQNYTQEQINDILASKDVVQARQKLKFLLDADLIGGTQEENKRILSSLQSNLVESDLSSDFFLSGVIDYEQSIRLQDLSIDSNDDTLLDSSKICLKRSIESLKKAISYNPENFDARTKLGLAYQEVGRLFYADYYYQKSVEEFDKVLLVTPEDHWIRFFKVKSMNLSSGQGGKFNSKEICEELNLIDVDVFTNKNRINEFRKIKSEHQCLEVILF